MPMSIAIRIPVEFEHFVHEDEVLGREKWRIDLGGSNAALFSQLFAFMFEEVTVLGPDDDAVLRARVAQLATFKQRQSSAASKATELELRERALDALPADLRELARAASRRPAGELAVDLAAARVVVVVEHVNVTEAASRLTVP